MIGRPTAFRACLRIHRFDHGTQLRPRNHSIHFRQKLRATGRLPVFLKPRQRLLFRPGSFAGLNDAANEAGKSDLP